MYALDDERGDLARNLLKHLGPSLYVAAGGA
jgi:hypothetical protein